MTRSGHGFLTTADGRQNDGRRACGHGVDPLW